MEEQSKSLYILWRHWHVCKNTLNMAYGVMEDYIVDNHLCMFNPKIHSTDLFDEIEIENFSVILATDQKELYNKLVELLLAKNFELSQIYTFESNKNRICLFILTSWLQNR